MPYDVLVKKLDSLSEIQKKSVFDYINFLIYQNSDMDNDDIAKKRLEYLDSLDNKEVSSRSVQDINQYINDIRNEERVF
jgi:hypothetical protein